MKALFISRNDIINNSPLLGSVDADHLMPFIQIAQLKYIKNLLGTILYERIEGDILNGVPFTGVYKELVDDHIKPCLLWYACAEYIPFSSVQFHAAGATKHVTDVATAPTKTELDILASKSSDNAEYYALRLQNFLIAKVNQIPEYLQTTGDAREIYPDQSSQYFPGIQL